MHEQSLSQLRFEDSRQVAEYQLSNCKRAYPHRAQDCQQQSVADHARVRHAIFEVVDELSEEIRDLDLGDLGPGNGHDRKQVPWRPLQPKAT